jgi:hypothetical protein
MWFDSATLYMSIVANANLNQRYTSTLVHSAQDMWLNSTAKFICAYNYARAYKDLNFRNKCGSIPL